MVAMAGQGCTKLSSPNGDPKNMVIFIVYKKWRTLYSKLRISRINWDLEKCPTIAISDYCVSPYQRSSTLYLTKSVPVVHPL